MHLKPTVTYAGLGSLAGVLIVALLIGMASQTMLATMGTGKLTMPAIVRWWVQKTLLGDVLFVLFCAWAGYAHGKPKQRATALQEANAAKDQFFSILGHDLKSPLSIVLGFSGLLADNYDTFDEDVKKHYVRNIHDSTNRLYTLIEDLLEWSRLQMGKMQWQPECCELFSLADETLILLQNNADKKQITLRLQIPEHTTVYADVQMVKTMIRNLVSNAIKFTSTGGTVTIASKVSGDYEEITVADTGVGISPENLRKLFRLDVVHSTPGTAKERGSGLGLILCKEFVEQHGGQIEVTSTIGKGSQFRFTLPKANGGYKQVRQKNLPQADSFLTQQKLCGAEYDL